MRRRATVLVDAERNGVIVYMVDASRVSRSAPRVSLCPEDGRRGEGTLVVLYTTTTDAGSRGRQEKREQEVGQGEYGCIGGVKLNACAQGASRRGAPVPPVGGCETERAEFADQSRRISRLRYTSPRPHPRFSMGIGEPRTVPTLADTHQVPVRTVNRGRDATLGVRSVTNDIVRNYDLSCYATHVRYTLKCDDESGGPAVARQLYSDSARRSSTS